MNKRRKAARWLAAFMLLLAASLPTYRPPGAAVYAAGAPITIQAEDYDAMSGINDDGDTVGGLDDGDWLAYYDVNIGSGYNLFKAKVAVAGSNAGQNLEIRLDSASGPLAGILTVADTGGWTTYAEQSAPLAGASGIHDIYIVADGTFGAANIDAFTFDDTGGGSTAYAIPGRVEAESYSAMNGVQTEPTDDDGGGENVGYIDTGDWMDYSVDVTSSGSYTVEFRVSSITATGQIQLRSGGSVLATANVPNTWYWQSWTTVSATVSLTAAPQTLRLYASQGGFNVNWVDFQLNAPPQPSVGNPGFETGTLAPWTTQNNGAVETGNTHSGTKAANLGTAYSGVDQTITGLAPATSYTLTAWVKANGDLVYLGAKDFGGSEVNTTSTSGDYAELTVTFTTGSSNTSANIFVWKNEGTAASFADDFTLIPTPFYQYSGADVGFNTQDPYWQTSADLNALYDKVVDTGVKWVRATLFWDMMEQTPGTIDWTQADLIFDTIAAKGLKAVFVIRSAPGWAADGADTSNHDYEPTDGVAYGNICYKIAKRYLNRGVTIAFELGNEQNTVAFNKPSVDPVAYTNRMLVPGSTGIRAAAAELGVAAPTVLVGGFAPVDPANVPGSVAPLDYMQAIYDNGGGGYFDSVAYHPYTYVSAPTATHWTFAQLQSIVDLMDSEGDTNRNIWATEVGWATGTGDGEVSEAEQSSFTAQAFDLWFGLPYAGPMIWYELVDNVSYDTYRENTFGLLHSDASWSAKPAFDTFVSKIIP